MRFLLALRRIPNQHGWMRYHSLDFWRGVACLSVVVFHSTFYASEAVTRFTEWLKYGVPIFFVISGYCIAAAAENCVRKQQSPLTYFKRRFRRIYPPYWIAFVAFAVVIGGLDIAIPRLFSDANQPIPRPWWLNGWQAFGNLTLTETWRAHVTGPHKGFFLGHAWTLCFEEQFYAVMGLIVAVAPRRLFAASAAVTVAVAGMLAAGAQPYVHGFFFDGHWLEFAAGILVYRAVNYGGKLPAGGILIAGIAWLYWEPEYAIAFAFAIALLLLHPLDRMMSGSRVLSPVAWCGVMCYSLYLIHWPVCKGISHGAWMLGARSDAITLAVVVPLCMAASVVAGYGFHVFVERRFLNPPSLPAMLPGQSESRPLVFESVP